MNKIEYSEFRIWYLNGSTAMQRMREGYEIPRVWLKLREAFNSQNIQDLPEYEQADPDILAIETGFDLSK